MQKSISYLWPKWRQNGQNRYPIYDQNGWKTLPFGAAHTYIVHIREYPPPPPLGVDWKPLKCVVARASQRVPKRHAVDIEEGLPPATDDITFYLIGPRLDVSMCVCHVVEVKTNVCPNKHQPYNSAGNSGSSLQFTSLENFAMPVVSLLILLAGAGVSVCDFYSSALNSHSFSYI